jgi:hypothetical protein
MERKSEWKKRRKREMAREGEEVRVFVQQPKSATRLGTSRTPCAHGLDRSHEAELLASRSAFTAPGPF